ncbi:MAG: insulinase family protein, partial [Nitrospira sp.]|nr:insulinase family protein [Nitrospira sp.]
MSMRRVREEVAVKHRAVFLVGLGVLWFSALTACAGLGDVATGDPRTMRFAPVEFSPPEPERLVLDNGMVVYLLEDHELPLITITATMRTGGWLDPSDRVGLASLTGTVMRTGGGGRFSAEQVDEELEQFAGNISIGIGRESGSASLDVLSKDLKRGLEIFAALLRTPAFDPARVEL